MFFRVNSSAGLTRWSSCNNRKFIPLWIYRFLPCCNLFPSVVSALQGQRIGIFIGALCVDVLALAGCMGLDSDDEVSVQQVVEKVMKVKEQS